MILLINFALFVLMDSKPAWKVFLDELVCVIPTLVYIAIIIVIVYDEIKKENGNGKDDKD
jgi:hypothetical protein